MSPCEIGIRAVKIVHYFNGFLTVHDVLLSVIMLFTKRAEYVGVPVVVPKIVFDEIGPSSEFE